MVITPTKGCGQPGHLGGCSDEGTQYCLTCEYEAVVAENRRFRTALESIIRHWDRSGTFVSLFTAVNSMIDIAQEALCKYHAGWRQATNE